jgi:PEP-CTERM motif
MKSSSWNCSLTIWKRLGRGRSPKTSPLVNSTPCVSASRRVRSFQLGCCSKGTASGASSCRLTKSIHRSLGLDLELTCASTIPCPSGGPPAYLHAVLPTAFLDNSPDVFFRVSLPDGDRDFDANVDNFSFSAPDPATDVPEPATLAIMVIGLLGLGAMRRRRSSWRAPTIRRSTVILSR